MWTQLYRAAVVATWVLAATWPSWGEGAGTLVEDAWRFLDPEADDQRVAELP